MNWRILNWVARLLVLSLPLVADAGSGNLKKARLTIEKKYVTGMTANRAKNIVREVEVKVGDRLQFSTAVDKSENQPVDVRIDEPVEYKLVVSKIEANRIELVNPDPDHTAVSWSPMEKDGQVKSIQRLTGTLTLSGQNSIYIAGGPAGGEAIAKPRQPNQFGVFFIVKRAQPEAKGK